MVGPPESCIFCLEAGSFIHLDPYHAGQASWRVSAQGAHQHWDHRCASLCSGSQDLSSGHPPASVSSDKDVRHPTLYNFVLVFKK